MEHSNPLHFDLWNPAITLKINLAIFFVAHFVYLEECKCACVCAFVCLCEKEELLKLKREKIANYM